MQRMILPLKRYADFDGRASRSEYWWFQGFLALMALPALALYVGGREVHSLNMIMLSALVALLLLFALAVPALAVTVRRLHDLDRTGWWAVALLMPYPWIELEMATSLLLLVFMLLPGTRGSNRFDAPASQV